MPNKPTKPAKDEDYTPQQAKDYTPAQAAAVLGVSTTTLARWADTGRLPATRTLGGHRRYPRQVVEFLKVGVVVKDGAA